MPELPDDHVDSIKEGTLAYWMSQDEDVPRGSIGEVLELDGEDCVVQFPKKQLKISAAKLNVSDFQKGTYVHLTDDGLSDEMLGEVKGLSGEEDGKLLIEIEGEEKHVKPKYLFKCDLQVGMFAFWKKSDDDVPSGHLGQVLADLNEKGKVKVKFPNGSWRFRPKDLVKSHVQPGSYVQWTSSDDDIAVGEIGEATGEINDSGKVRVAFSKDTWSFKVDTLIALELQLGAFVKWQNHDDDVKKGELGQVVGIKVSQGRLRVQFSKGRWKFKANELNLCRIQPGSLVLWSQEDEDIPKGDIGEVIRLDDGKLSIQWPKGHWSMRMNEIRTCGFQKGDRVQWTNSDDDIPEGDIGIIMGVKYKEDSGNKLYVNWPKGRYSMDPLFLQALNFDADGADQLKRAFKRFDKNGDGKLSEEEFVHVLGQLGGSENGLAPEECKKLFVALDKDDNGKLTVSEFIDYVFSDASSAAKMILPDGFGLDAFLGFAGQEEEEEREYDSDDDDRSEMKGLPEDRPKKSVVPSESAVGIDGDTEVSRVEWATAMLSVGVPRAAALTSFEAVTQEIEGNGEVLKLKDLACELNGMGGTAGVKELCPCIGSVKQGHVALIDLDTPSEEVELERELARKTGLDGLVFEILYNARSLEKAAEEFPKAKLSALEKKVLSEMSGEELVNAVQETSQSSESLSAVASWQRARENCQREVQEIIDQCKADGKKYEDPDFNPLENENKVLYVDKKKPGWDCTVRYPEGGWKRAPDIKTGRHPVLVHDRCDFSDVKQGHIGDCFFVAALAAMAASRKSFLRQALVAYDMDVGVYGVMFCEEMHFTYEIIDDFVGVNENEYWHFARSATRVSELWVSIIEKAYFKHMTCLEMCDGGHSVESIFSFLGGVSGKYYPTKLSEARRYWKTIHEALEDGEVLTNSFEPPSKGKYANMGEGEGQCGEQGMAYGLHDGHAYTLLRTGEVDGHHLLCIRNPWASGEWTGPWSDKSPEWTREAREEFGIRKDRKHLDGAFWMEDKDFVQLAERVNYNITFGPTWQCVAQYGCFGKAPPFQALARNNYRACEDDEISFKRGEKLEISRNPAGSWLYGVHKPSGKEGYFRKKDVDMRCEDTFKYELKVSDVAVQSKARITIAVFRENQKKAREWYTRKSDKKHYKDTKYADAYLQVHGSDGRRICKTRFYKRHAWCTVKASSGPFRIYLSCESTDYKRFALYAFTPAGQLWCKKLEISRMSFITEVGATNAADTIRENIYAQTTDVVNEFISLGYSLLDDHPQVAESVMQVASTVSDYVEAGSDQVRDFVNSDQVQGVTDKVKDIMNSDRARQLTNEVGNLMNRASSWLG